MAEHGADTVLESTTIAVVLYALIDGGEGEAVAVGCRAIAGKRRHALHGAGLGAYVAVVNTPVMRLRSVPSSPAMGGDGRRCMYILLF